MVEQNTSLPSRFLISLYFGLCSLILTYYGSSHCVWFKYDASSVSLFCFGTGMLSGYFFSNLIIKLAKSKEKPARNCLLAGLIGFIICSLSFPLAYFIGLALLQVLHTGYQDGSFDFNRIDYNHFHLSFKNLNLFTIFKILYDFFLLTFVYYGLFTVLPYSFTGIVLVNIVRDKYFQNDLTVKIRKKYLIHLLLVICGLLLVSFIFGVLFNWS